MPKVEADKTWSVLELLNWTARFFEKKEIDAPRLNAELLLAHVLGWPRIQLYTHFDDVPGDAQRAAFRELVLKRAARHPVQYLLGKVEFMSRQFLVNPHVLIPRPETELLVETALEQSKREDRPRGPVVELGTGSGVVAVTLALELPEAEIVATDVSTEALAVARENADRHGVAARIRFLQGDWFAPLRESDLGHRIAQLVSNPPYVAERDYPTLMPEVRDHEPAVALKAGPDGLDSYRRIVAEAPDMLAPGGGLALELGCGQSEAVVSLLASTEAFSEPETRKDFQGIDRVLTCKRR